MSTFVGYLKAIVVEEQNNWFHNFLKGSSQMNVIAWLKFEFSYYDVADLEDYPRGQGNSSYYNL